MNFLSFELTEVDDGVSSLEAMASTALEQHAAVMAVAGTRSRSR